MTKRTYKTEFPDFDNVDALVAQLPATFEDTSWHNDTSPSWQNDQWFIIVDYADAAKRELDLGCRFNVLAVKIEDGERVFADQSTLATDDWSEVIELVRNL